MHPPEQTSLLQGDVLSQHRFVLQAIVSDAVRLLCEPCTGLWATDEHAAERALVVLRQAADELRRLGHEEPIPF